MKKYLVGLCMGILVMGMTACSGKENSDNNQNIGVQNSQGAQPGTAGEKEPGPESQPQGGASDAELLETQGGWSAEMQQLKDAIVAEFGGDYTPNMQATREQLEGLLGLSPDMYEDYLYEMPMISVNVDTLLIVKAKEDKAEAVEDAIKAYQSDLQNNSRPYPMNVGKIQASNVETIGNYVCFVQLGADTDAIYEAGDDEAVIEHCQKQNELALNIIRQNLSTQ